jgi:flavin reductase (DIM6/NTAB) family NADH-FMN oxidoreductase RutF
MIFDPNDYSPEAFYYLMLQSIIPRPIAWVLSENANGTYNAAPFSFYSGVASQPPLLMIAVAWKDHANRKDTWVNIEERLDFVVHVPPAAMAKKMVATSIKLPAGESELNYAQVKTAIVEGERLPRLEGPKLAMFCNKHSITEIGDERIGLIIGEIKRIWVADEAVRLEGKRATFDPKIINPLTRLGAQHYGLLGPIIDLPRPKP